MKKKDLYFRWLLSKLPKRSAYSMLYFALFSIPVSGALAFECTMIDAVKGLRTEYFLERDRITDLNSTVNVLEVLFFLIRKGSEQVDSSICYDGWLLIFLKQLDLADFTNINMNKTSACHSQIINKWLPKGRQIVVLAKNWMDKPIDLTVREKNILYNER